jgi:hypothetical protein
MDSDTFASVARASEPENSEASDSDATLVGRWCRVCPPTMRSAALTLVYAALALVHAALALV